MSGTGPLAYGAAITLVTTALTTALSGITPAGDINYPTELQQTGIDTSPTVYIHGHMNITGGTGTTSVTITCLDDSGTAVSTSLTQTLVGTNSQSSPFIFRDNSGVRKGSYTIQVQLVGATTNGAVNRIYAEAQT